MAKSKDRGREIRGVSLLELCVRSAIDNLSHLGDVGETDISLLKRILPHCNADQLMHIETSTTGRDLSPITDELWRKCYARKFGNDAVDMVKERMANRNCKFKWKQLYQAKLREQEEVQKKGVNRLRELYKEQDTQKQSRKLKPCDVKPPESKRRKSGTGGSSAPASKFGKSKGRLMQKSRMDYANSNEVKMQASMRNKAAGGNGLNQRPGGQSSGRRV